MFFFKYFDHFRLDNHDYYYYPWVVPSYEKRHTPDTMFTTLSHRFISS